MFAVFVVVVFIVVDSNDYVESKNKEFCSIQQNYVWKKQEKKNEYTNITIK